MANGQDTGLFKKKRKKANAVSDTASIGQKNSLSVSVA
jgi:hypothetical protein